MLRLLLLGNQLLGKTAVGIEAGAGGDQLADDDILLQAHQVVHLALDSGLGEDLGGLLEGGGGEEGVRGQRGLGNTHEKLGIGRFLQGLAGFGIHFTGGDAVTDLSILDLHLQHIGHGTGEQACIPGLLHPDLAHHLADDDLDMLIVDVHALLTVYLQNLLDEVVMHGGGAADAQHIVGVQSAILELLTLFDDISVLHLQARVGHGIGAGIAVIGSNDNVQQAALGGILKANLTGNLGQCGHLLGLAGLKQLLHSGKALGDVAAGHAAGVEGTHSQLSTGLTDGLGRDDTHGFAGANGLGGGQVHAVALGADTAVGLAGQHGADLGGVNVELLQEGCIVLGHHVILGDEHLVGAGLQNIPDGEAALQALGELLNDLAVFLDLGDYDALVHAAVVLTDDDILAHIHHAAGQVAGVGGTQSGIGQALTGATGGGEVVQHGHALAEVGLDGDLDGLTGGVGHQAAHTGELTDLLHAAAGAGVGHHEDGVILIQAGSQSVGNVGGGLLPLADHQLIALFIGDEAHVVLVLDVHHALLGLGDELVLLLGHGHVGDGDGDGGTGGILIAGGLDVIQHLGGHGEAVLLDGAVHDLAQELLAADLGDLVVKEFIGGSAVLIEALHKAQILGNIAVEDDAPSGTPNHMADLFPVQLLLYTDPNGLVYADDVLIIGHEHLVLVAVDIQRIIGLLLVGELVVVLTGQGEVDILRPELVVLQLAHAVFKALNGQIVGAQHHILGRHGDGAAVLRTQQVIGRQHQQARLGLGLGGQGDMNGHLVAVEVGVEGGAVQGMQLQSPAIHQHRLKGLDAQTVQGRRTVKHDGVILDDNVQRIPHLGDTLIHHLLGGFDVIGHAILHQLLHDEGAEQLHGHLLGHAALIDLQLGAYHNNGAAGVVHALAQQVLAETALLTLEHVAQGLERSVIGAGDGAPTAAVVDQRIHGLLEHTLFIADDDVRGLQLHKTL